MNPNNRLPGICHPERYMDWAKEAVALGAGEILLTSMNNDGTKNGFALGITKLLSNELPVPVIASGGAGSMEHFKEVFYAKRKL